MVRGSSTLVQLGLEVPVFSLYTPGPYNLKFIIPLPQEVEVPINNYPF